MLVAGRNEQVGRKKRDKEKKTKKTEAKVKKKNRAETAHIDPTGAGGCLEKIKKKGEN